MRIWIWKNKKGKVTDINLRPLGQRLKRNPYYVSRVHPFVWFIIGVILTLAAYAGLLLWANKPPSKELRQSQAAAQLQHSNYAGAGADTPRKGKRWQ